MRDRRPALAVGAALALLVAGVAFALVRSRWHVPVGRPFIGLVISDAGLALQLGALVLGVLVVNLVPAPIARRVIVIEGSVCLLGFGLTGLGCLAFLLTWWAVLDARCLGRGRFVLAIALLATVDATAWCAELAPAGLLFAMIFSLRLLVLAYDRWQHREARTPLGEFLVYTLPAPLVMFPPYLTFIPLFGGFAQKIAPGLTRAKLVRIARHVALAILFEGLRQAMNHVEVPTMYGHFLAVVLEFAAFAHLVLPLLLLHGIDVAPPLDRPFLATRYSELWQRFASHQKDAQMFLFYTPALLHLRRHNRYVAIVLATLWTLVVGNTLIHLALNYCFFPDPGPWIARMMVANVAIGVVLAIDLCLLEHRRRTHAPARGLASHALGWAVTMTIAASVRML
ncbi:MAG: hypothetical protein IPQ07_27790 [Myxococcales bacterium]|nr:hypothetical protein [Myxococcales bacterium]